MILQALDEYYARKSADPQSGLAPEGFEPKAIPFAVVIDRDGQFVQLADRREGAGKKREARAQLVPQSVKRAYGVAANLLWDNAEYVLGIDTRGKPERVAEQHAAFIQRIRDAFDDEPADFGVQAVLAFLTRCREEGVARMATDPAWAEILDTNPLMSFQLVEDCELICQRRPVLAALLAGDCGVPDGRCLVSGKPDVIERLHPAIRNVWGAQAVGANIVSINNKNESGNNGGPTPAFASYGKQQGYNAPVGKRAAFAYTTALNHLLARGSRQRLQVGDASAVFWAEKASGAMAEQVFLDFLDPPRDDPDRGTEAVASLYAAVNNGVALTADDGQRFYVLGLAPNAARISVRFWHVATVGELGQAICRHLRDIEIDRPDFDVPHLSLFRLLASTALQGKADNIPPNLGGELVRAILKGLPYPETLMQGVMRRLRAEQEVSYPRAALLKAYLIRNRQDKEIHVSLNPENSDPGYRLGRLFAALERAQELAQGNLNAGIRERYYGAFSTTPVTVLPLLMKLKNHHLAKIESRGAAVNLEKTLGEIMDGMHDIPARLPLAGQARFAVGYYQQRQAFFRKNESEPSASKEQEQ